MNDLRVPGLVGTALRCYPARWRRRHGAEAAELAALLISDGAAPRSIALSYLAGAAREWLVPHPSRRLSTVACALLVAACSVGLSAGLLASAVPASAVSTAGTAGTADTSGHGYCQPGSTGSGTGLTPAVGRPHAIIWEAPHGRSC
jgi:hypothetical protein